MSLNDTLAFEVRDKQGAKNICILWECQRKLCFMKIYIPIV